MSKLPHIVFLVPNFDQPAPRNIRAKQLISYLSKDYQISVVCLQPNIKSLTIEQKDHYNLVSAPYSLFSHFITLRLYKGKPLNPVLYKFSQIFGYFLKRVVLFPDPWVWEHSRLLNALEKLPVPADVLVASIMPFSSGGVAIEHLKRCPSTHTPALVCDIGDPLAGNVALSTNFKKTRLVEYEKTILNSSDYIVVTNSSTAEYYSNEYAFDKSNIYVIPQGAPIFKNIENKSSKANQNLTNVVYAGVFLESIRDPRRLFSVLKKYSDTIRLSVFGGINKSFSTNNNHIIFNGWKPHSTIITSYDAADCVLFFDNYEGIQTSGKIYELLATRKPILFVYEQVDSVVKKQVEHYGHIIFVHNRSEAYEAIFENLAERLIKANRWFDTDEGKDYNENQFSWQSRALSFKKVLQTALSAPTRQV